MKAKMAMAMAAALIAGGFGSGHAEAGLYKWVDKSGRVHYSDKPAPPDAKSEKAMEVKFAGKEDLGASRSALEKREANAKTAEEQKKAQEKAAEEQKAAEMKAQECASVKEVLNQLVSGRRLKVMDEKGNPKVLNEEEIASRRARAEAEAARACGAAK